MTLQRSPPLEGQYVFPDLLEQFRQHLHKYWPPIDHWPYIVRIVTHFGTLQARSESNDRINRDLQCLWDELFKAAVRCENPVSPARRDSEQRRQWNHLAQLAKQLRGIDEHVDLDKIKPLIRDGRVDSKQSPWSGMTLDELHGGIGTLRDDTLFLPTLEKELFDNVGNNMQTYESLHVFATLATHRTDKDLQWNTQGMLLAMRVLQRTLEEEDLTADVTGLRPDKMLLTWIHLPILWIQSHGIHLLKEADAPWNRKAKGTPPGPIARDEGSIVDASMTRERWEFWKQRAAGIELRIRVNGIGWLAGTLLAEMNKVEREYNRIMRVEGEYNKIMSGNKGWSCTVM